MRPEDLSARLHALGVAVIRLLNNLPQRVGSREVAGQITRSSTGAAANYRSACRGRSRKEFVAKLGVALEEAEETVGWLEMMRDAGLAPLEDLTPLLCEARELRAILAASCRTARRNLRTSNHQINKSRDQQI